MEFFLDSADAAQIKTFLPYGMVDGITTNPSLMAKQSGKSFQEIVDSICSLVPKQVSIEVAATNYEQMLVQGKKILSMWPQVILKLPLTWDGVMACRYFANTGALVNMTLCFSLSQAIIAARAGAFCVSPFVGRIEDAGGDGLKFLAEIVQVFKNYNFKTKVLAASMRDVAHVYEAAKIGADIVTIAPAVMEKLIHSPFTDIGLRQFESDWQQSKLVI
jgi:transaldolase